MRLSAAQSPAKSHVETIRGLWITLHFGALLEKFRRCPITANSFLREFADDKETSAPGADHI
jgi:hypothetical protein